MELLTRLKEYRDFPLFCIMGIIILISSAYILTTGSLDYASVVLGRRKHNWIGIIGSYFVHGSWQHLISNLLPYLWGVFIIYYCTKNHTHSKWIDLSHFIACRFNWIIWFGMQLLLMVLIGLMDLSLNKIYDNPKFVSIGMSDLVSAIFAGSTLIVLILFTENLKSLKISKLLVLALIAFVNILMLLCGTYRHLWEMHVNFIAHICGVIGSILVFGLYTLWPTPTMTEVKSGLIPFIVYCLLILLAILCINLYL